MKVKIPKLLRGKKLRATTARRTGGVPTETDYGEIAEPNMKLSRALLIVLLLHIVAVSGIIAFNAIKTRQNLVVQAPLVNTEDNAAVATAGPTLSSDTPNPRSVAVQNENGSRDAEKMFGSLSKQRLKDEYAKSTDQEQLPTASGKIYTVVKGDNPVTIARKLKVSYADLIALNHIEDPRRLQIGQKLSIPKAAKTTKTKKPAK
jgi:LysM repeat protein